MPPIRLRPHSSYLAIAVGVEVLTVSAAVVVVVLLLLLLLPMLVGAVIEPAATADASTIQTD